MPGSLREQFPLRMILGQEDVTYLLDSGMTFSNVDPGGFEMGNLEIPRDMAQTLRGTYARLDCGLGVAFEGRVSQLQRSLGNRTKITLEGLGARFKENLLAQIFVDRDPRSWIDIPFNRKVALAVANISIADFSFTQQIAGLVCALPNQALGAQTTAETWYAAPQGVTINNVGYVGSDTALPAGWEVPTLFITPDDAMASVVSVGLTFDGTKRSVAPGAPKRYVVLREWSNGNAVTPAAGANRRLKAIAVFGSHGLTTRVIDATTPDGLWPSDIVRYLVGLVPSLQLGVIPDSSTVIPQSAYPEAVPLDQILGDLSVFDGKHWGVWEALGIASSDMRPRVDFRPRPTLGQFSAVAMRANCDVCDIREDLTNLYDTVVMTYTDPTQSSPQSVTVSLDNPLLDAAGQRGRALPVSGGVLTPAAATAFAQIVLIVLQNQARVAGSVQISSAIDSVAGPMPPYMLKSGLDRLRIPDLPSFDAFGAYNDVPLSRMECTISESGISTSLDIGTGANLVETIGAQLRGAASIAGLSG